MVDFSDLIPKASSGANEITVRKSERPASGGLTFDDLVPRTEPTNGGFAPRAAREQEYSPEQTREAYREGMRGQIARERSDPDSLAGKAGAALRGFVGMVPFGEDAVAGLASVLPADLDYSGSLADRFQKNRDYVELQREADWDKNPGSTIVGSLGGLLGPGGRYIAGASSLPSMMGRSALVGGAYGTAGGASSNGSLDERAAQAVQGGALGTVFGGAAPAAARAIGAGVGAVAGPFVQRVRERINPNAVADDMVAKSLMADRAAGRTISEADLAAAKANQQPLVLGDIGGETTRGLARTAGNASPVASGVLNEAVDPRYATQGSRFGTFVSNLFDYPDPTGMIDRLRQIAQRTNRPAYRELYDAFPDVRTPGLASLLEESPLIQKLGRKVLDENPNLVKAGMSRDMSNPTLEFWDRLQRQLRQLADNASANRLSEDAAMYGSLRSQLLGELDTATAGRFQQVRQGAAQFFDAEDAVEAGQKFFRQNSLSDLGAARKALAAMPEHERKLFAQGFAAEMAHAGTGTGDTKNLAIQAWLNNPNARAKMELALGPEQAGKIQSFVGVESAMNKLRSATQGNSSTMRQLLDSGLFGVNLGNAVSSGLIGTGINMATGDEPLSLKGIAIGAARAYVARNGGLDPRTAELIARRLASNDPKVVNKVLDMAMRKDATRKFLLGFEGELTKIAAQLGGDRVGERPRGYAEGGPVAAEQAYQMPSQNEIDLASLPEIDPFATEKRLAQGAVEGVGTAARYLRDRPLREMPGDIARFGSAIYEGAKNDPIGFALDMTPIVGEIRSGMDARELDQKAAAAEAAGDEQAASHFRQLSALAAAGVVPALGMAGRAGKRAAKAGKLADEAGDVARIADEAMPAVAKEELGLPPPATDALEQAAARVEATPPRTAEPPPTAAFDEAAPRPAAALDEAASPAVEDPRLPPDVAPAPAAAADAGDSATTFHMDIERQKREAASRVRLSNEEKATLNQLAVENKLDPREVERVWRETRAEYPTTDWVPIEPNKIVKGDDGTFEITAREQSYGFNRPKGVDRAGNEPDPKLAGTMARKLADEVLETANRADSGDRNAQVIMRARNWYAAMRDRLRAEFGSFADVFADVLGTTSAQTNVRQNWDNAIEALGLFTKGYYDDTLTKLDDWFKNGGVIGNAKTEEGAGFLENGWVNNHERIKKEALPAAREQAKAEGLTGKAIEARAKDIAFEAAQAEFPLITKGDGRTLFNANSPSTMGAFLDLFRQVQPGSAPKTPNFTGNLIGYSRKATIDLWAARLLRRLHGQKALPPIAESGVSGTHMADTSKVGGEFGFGQEVFKQAADILRKDPRFKDLGDDDLQAIVWFLEKENWGKRGWTNKAGEGGSLEFEANIAGIDDRQWVKDQRRLMDTDPTAAERKKLTVATNPEGRAARDAAQARFDEIRWAIEPYPNGKEPTAVNVRDRLMQEQGITNRGEAMDAARALQGEARQLRQQVRLFDNKVDRLGRLTTESAETKANAARALDEAKATVRRMVGGLSPDRAEDPATNVMFSGASKRLLGSVADDPALLAAKASPTKGRYITPGGDIYDERSFDLEIVARQGFDPMPLWQQMVKEAKARNQDSVFLSEVVEAGKIPDANPGVEIYFSKKVDEATADAITKRINELGVDAGFTYAVDVRQANRAAQNAGAAPGDFVGIRVQYIPEFGGGLEGRQTAIQKMLDLVEEVSATPGVSNSRYVEYDTQVAFGGDYDAILAGSLPDGRRAAWTRERVGKGAQGADRGAGLPSGPVGGEAVRRWRGGPAAPKGRERQKALDADLESFIANSAPRPTPRRFAMGGPVFSSVVEPRISALSRPKKGALSTLPHR